MSKGKGKSLDNLRKRNVAESESINSNEVIPKSAPVEGCRIVDVNFLCKQMICTHCSSILSLNDITEENLIGLACKWHITCRACGAVNTVLTSKSQANPKTNRQNFDINLKAAIGLIDAGIGAAHVNAFLSCLNIPEVHESLLKRSERVIGPEIENVANESCVSSSLLERELEHTGLTILQESLPSPDSPLDVSPIAVSYDMGWQKRGNGRSYSSLTGHGCLIGQKSKKVLAYGTRNISCKACHYGKREHDCRRNWSGSAKAMEADLALELVAQSTPLKAANVKVGTVVGDDDSSTAAKLRSEVGDVKKVSDINHAKKNLGNSLYSLRSNHRSLTPMVIKYLQRCFSYALQQNRGQPDLLRKAITNIVPHAFDIHRDCGSWCGYVKDPESYVHKGLPKGIGLVGERLHSELQNVFQKFASNSDCLAPCGSTQCNENFNAIVASKAPKMRHYGSSESNDFRVAAAVCQKNVGVTYVSDVKKSLMISPGHNTIRYRARLSLKRKSLAEKRKTCSFKQRRLFKNLSSMGMLKVKEAREGVTYKTGMAYDPDINSVFYSDLVPVGDACSTVFFDVETTGLSGNAELLQIGAVGSTSFSCYFYPHKGIPDRVSEITSLRAVDGLLYYEGKPVISGELEEGLCAFIDYLKSFKKVVLVGHNVQFDARMVLAAVNHCNKLDDFGAVVAGFSDTLPLLKKVLPGRKSYAQGKLVEEVLQDFSNSGHNAHIDALNLKKICEKVFVGEDMILQYSFTLQSFLKRQEQSKRKRELLPTLKPLRDKGVSGYMVNRLAEKGIGLQLLMNTWKSEGDEGVKNSFDVVNVSFLA
ncbi:uncharacterized protein LOC124171235 [Ischnura elegans]|uniref:uncharacterized protein LOC124171235 n=1 Tax=Ischnura elegans TaxID=197161 RepID=UPI001ED886FB|nr:uncharacterized protein LOC124171235 [Ischnura elegans]